jgi:glutamate--cysteine ligase catalytic subunit
VGTPQPWPVSKKNLNYVREAGVRQFISTYNRVKDFQGDELMWGDEVEYGIFILEEEDGVKRVKLSLRAKEVSYCWLILVLRFFVVLVVVCCNTCRD